MPTEPEDKGSGDLIEGELAALMSVVCKNETPAGFSRGFYYLFASKIA